MSYKRRRTRATESEDFLIVVALTAGVFWVHRQWPWTAVFGVSGTIIWWLVVQDTECGVWLDNKRRGCANPARGRLGACHLTAHKRRKWNEVRVALGRRPKPEQRPAARRPRGIGQPTPAPLDLATLGQQHTRSRIIRIEVVAAALSIPASLASVVATILQVMAQI
jgi:hypothetical protein